MDAGRHAVEDALHHAATDSTHIDGGLILSPNDGGAGNETCW